PRAASAGVSVTAMPSAPSGSAFSRARFHARTSWPAARMLRAIGAPMMPVPRTATTTAGQSTGAGPAPPAPRSRVAPGLDSRRMPSVERDFPLFPLGLVAIPTEYVPLHIFEERYKTMIGECLERECEFGIVWLADDELKGIGCAVTVTRVLERFDDGRMNILCQGTRPFRLVERQEGLPYP